MSECAQVMIMTQVTCLGCGKKDTICLEIGVKDGQSLACKDCIKMLFERAEVAVQNEKEQQQDSTDGGEEQ